MKNCSFHCTQCGACCRQLPLFGSMYAWLDNGHGQCRYFDPETAACGIYELRPMICRVEEGYHFYFRHLLPEDEYILKTMECCEILRNKLGIQERNSCQPGPEHICGVPSG